MNLVKANMAAVMRSEPTLLSPVMILARLRTIPGKKEAKACEATTLQSSEVAETPNPCTVASRYALTDRRAASLDVDVSLGSRLSCESIPSGSSSNSADTGPLWSPPTRVPLAASLGWSTRGSDLGISARSDTRRPDSAAKLSRQSSLTCLDVLDCSIDRTADTQCPNIGRHLSTYKDADTPVSEDQSSDRRAVSTAAWRSSEEVGRPACEERLGSRRTQKN